jgi:hypothetical protein
MCDDVVLLEKQYGGCMYFLEMLLIVFMLWVVANIIRAVLFRTSKGGGFWGLYNGIIKEDLAKDQEAAIQAEVNRRMEAMARAAQAEKKGG